MFAAGDICEYDSPVHGRYHAVEHWDVAFNQGKTAALNMLGRDVAHEVVPYFYSVLGDWGELEYVGPAYGWDEEILRGSFEDGSFTNWYLQDGTVKAALTFGDPDDLEHAKRLIVGGGGAGRRAGEVLADLDSDLGGRAVALRERARDSSERLLGDSRASGPQAGPCRRSVKAAGTSRSQRGRARGRCGRVGWQDKTVGGEGKPVRIRRGPATVTGDARRSA